MNIENRLKLFRTEKTKILGFGRSHLRSVDLARRLESDVEKRIRKAKKDFSTRQAFLFFLWDAVRDRGDELLRREHFQFRVFDEGTVEFLDQNFIQRQSNGLGTKPGEVQEEISTLPEKARAVLQLHYQKGLSAKAIARKIDVPVDEVYHLWQHSLIYLWEALQNGDNEGFREQDDEAFWTMALKYLDGSASEKFVAQLNSEIHINKTRTKQYNDLRMIDGVMIGLGNEGSWPACHLLQEAGPPKSKNEVSPKRHATASKPAIKNGVVKLMALVGGLLAGLIATTRNLGEKIVPKPEDAGPAEPREDEADATALLPPEETVEADAAEPDSRIETGEPEVESESGPAQPEDAPEQPEPEPETDQLAYWETEIDQPEEPEPESESAAEETKPVLAVDGMEQSRPGVQFDQKKTRLPRFAVKPLLLKQIGAFALVGISIALLSLIVKKAGIQSGSDANSYRIIRSTGVEFANGENRSPATLKKGTHEMVKGTMEFQTQDSIGIIIEAPANFTIESGDKIKLTRGKMVAAVPHNAPNGLEIETNRFRFTTSEGEIGIVSDEKSIDVLVFQGEGLLENDGQKLGPGEGLRFFDTGPPESILARDEAHRFPESIPVIAPKAYGDNLVANHSFEVGLLSRSCKTERLYRDVPSGWKAGWQIEGVWTEALEQHSGTVRITDAIGGLPAPLDGERYLWINHGFVAQEIKALEPGAKYELSLLIGSHRNLGPGAGHLVRHVGGNTFRFGIWSGSEWIAETSGQLEAGQPFQEMKMEFQFPENGLPGMVPVLMLTGEVRIFYDKVILKRNSN